MGKQTNQNLGRKQIIKPVGDLWNGNELKKMKLKPEA